MIFTANLVISPYKDIGIDYIPHTVYFITMMHLFCNWMFLPYNFPHLFPSYFYPSPWATTCFSLSVSVLCLFICFVFVNLFSHPYMTIGKTIALTQWVFVGKVMFLLFNMLSHRYIFSSFSLDQPYWPNHKRNSILQLK